MSCETCKFFKTEGARDGAFGLCRRYPQALSKSGKDWCGEHFPAPIQRIPVVDMMTTGQDVPRNAGDIPKKRGRPRRINNASPVT